jgi:serine/threonine-protein kinase
MGEVYRARDPQLKRDVALKVLPEAFATDADRVARFQREAEVLASLSHPNIAIIYGLERVESQIGIVLELVEGATLEETIAPVDRLRAPAQPASPGRPPAGSALSLDETMSIARQVASALEAAHDRGIIHRDLKPANIKIAPDGTVKVLDFGLAKALGPEAASSSLTMSPTMSVHATGAGVILGTAAYMSPEQARGKAVDRRADIWAFGCVLYEMLTGRQLFGGGDTVSDAVAAILKTDPDWTTLPADTPAQIRVLLRRCLQKDVQRRLPHIGLVRMDLEDGTDPRESLREAAIAASVRPGIARRTARVAVSLLLALLAGTAGWFLSRTAVPRPTVMRFSLPSSENDQIVVRPTEQSMALDPNGRFVVYIARGNRLMMRAFDRSEPVWLGDGGNARSPFLSPDGKWVGYASGSELKKVPLSGGSPVTVCRFAGFFRGASWGDDGTIVFSTSEPLTGLLAVSESGGEPRVITRPQAAQGESDHYHPFVLPGSRAVLFTVAGPGGGATGRIAVARIDEGSHKTVVGAGSQPSLVDERRLLYVFDNELRAIRFDARRLETAGDPVSLGERVPTTGRAGAANYDVSDSGVLAIVDGVDATLSRSLVWVTRDGVESPVGAPRRAYQMPSVSPDGSRVAVSAQDEEADIWMWDVTRATFNRFTLSPGLDATPMWTPDGGHLIFSSESESQVAVYRQALDGTANPERVNHASSPRYPQSISPDGKRLVVLELEGTNTDLIVVKLDEGGESEPLLNTPSAEAVATISPDGRWMAYQSNETGRTEVWVRPFPNVQERRWQVSGDGGSRPAWSRDGRELYFANRSGDALMVVTVQSTTTFSAGRVRKLFDWPSLTSPGPGRTYDVAPDGRFLMIKDATTDSPQSTPQMLVVLNWTEELKQRVPTR